MRRVGDFSDIDFWRFGVTPNHDYKSKSNSRKRRRDRRRAALLVHQIIQCLKDDGIVERLAMMRVNSGNGDSTALK